MRDARPAQDAGWCAVLSDEQVGALVGEDEMPRVRQVAELRPVDRPTRQSCFVVWADGETYARIAAFGVDVDSTAYGSGLLFYTVFPLLGEDGHRLEDGTVVQLGDGAFVREDSVRVWSVVEDDDERFPRLVQLSMTLGEDLPGSLGEDELARVAERMEEMTPALVGGRAEVRPFELADLEPFLDGAQEEGLIDPWRGHSDGQ